MPQPERVTGSRAAALSLVAVVGLIAILIGMRWASTGDPGSSTSPTLAPTSAAVVPNPTSPLAPTTPPATVLQPAEPTLPPPSPTPTATPTADPLAGTGWTAIAGYTFFSVDWSPSGEYVLLRLGDEVSLIKSDGWIQVRTYDAPFLGYEKSDWVDDDSFLIYRQQEAGSGSDEPAVVALLGTLASADVEEVDVPQPVYDVGEMHPPIGLGNGHGAIAFSTTKQTSGDCGGIQCWTYRIWSFGGVTDEQPGVPVAWSLAGDRLAVIHQAHELLDGSDGPDDPGSTGAGAGWNGYYGSVEVLSWPNLDSVYASQDVQSYDRVAFDPTGRYLLVEDRGYSLLDVDTGSRSPSSQEWVNGPIWDAAGRSVSIRANDAIAYDVRGKRAERWTDAGKWIFGSNDGDLIAVAWFDLAGRRQSCVTLISGGTATRVDLPEQFNGARLFAYPSNDGRSVIVYAQRPGGDRQLLYQLP